LNRILKAKLPKAWPATVRSAMLHVVSLAKYAAVFLFVRPVSKEW
jgi:hypothetical protein